MSKVLYETPYKNNQSIGNTSKKSRQYIPVTKEEFQKHLQWSKDNRISVISKTGETFILEAVDFVIVEIIPKS